MANRDTDQDEEGGRKDRFLVILRHGIAEDKTADKPDEERSLTAEGHARIKQIALGLERVFPKVQGVYSSPLLRAVQTALWVAKAYRSRVKVKTIDALAPGAGADQLRAFLNQIKEKRIVIVGHEPSLSANLKALVGLPPTYPLELKKGGLYGVRLRSDGSASLEWLLSPRVLRKLAETE